MLTGSDIRRFRQALGMKQSEFAATWGIAQSTLSLIEGGRTPVSDQHFADLMARFAGVQHQPTFAEFVKQLDRDAAQSQAALTTCQSHHSTLTVWQWEDGFDLSRRPAAELAVDLITVRGLAQPAIVLQMPKKTDWWDKNEVIVFECCRREDLRENDLCLVQLRVARSKGSRTLIGAAHIAPARRGRTLQLEPITSAEPIFTPADETILALLVAVYRARHLRTD